MLKIYDVKTGCEPAEIGQCRQLTLLSSEGHSFQFTDNNVKKSTGLRIHDLMVPEGAAFTPAGAPNQYMPAIDRENMELIIRTLVHMLGGSVTLTVESTARSDLE